MATLSASARARLPARAFAYIDSQGRRRLPINDESHVRNALARFDQVQFESAEAREQARLRLIRAAKKYGIVPVGFFGGQLRKEREQGEIEARAKDVASLPRGTLTFLLTDIEGSTGLLRTLGERYTAVLRAVRSIIRSAVRKNGGHEVDARADEFFAVFEEATDALRAAIAIQRGLRAKRWPGGAQVRVRVGIHRGRTTLTETGYVGVAVHTAARVCAAAHGGQILLSSAAREALDGVIPGVRTRSLGRFALDGLPDREPLYQVEVDDLPSSFPRLRAATRRRA
jgi:class 3 adenylate cyclase